MSWILNKETHDIYTEGTAQAKVHNALEPPYPSIFWYVENNNVTHAGEPVCEEMGAFAHATKLREISFPSTIRSIGPYAFTNTALKHVELPRHCEYFSTSFPSDCIIDGGTLVK